MVHSVSWLLKRTACRSWHVSIVVLWKCSKKSAPTWISWVIFIVSFCTDIWKSFSRCLDYRDTFLILMGMLAGSTQILPEAAESVNCLYLALKKSVRFRIQHLWKTFYILTLNVIVQYKMSSYCFCILRLIGGALCSFACQSYLESWANTFLPSNLEAQNFFKLHIHLKCREYLKEKSLYPSPLLTVTAQAAQ